MSALIDITGLRFGRLVVLGKDPQSRPRIVRWLCLCDCGNSVSVLGYSLRDGHTKSCGCLSIDTVVARSSKHGEGKRGKKTAEYKAWLGIRKRCDSAVSKGHERYIDRGIQMCDEWRNDYVAFLSHIGRRPSPSHSVDRIDNDKGYEPGNVRWATPEEQANNTRANRRISHAGKTMSIAQWARTVGIDKTTLAERLDRGWEVDRALHQAPGQQGKKGNIRCQKKS
jgi:hypothetical protein